MEGGRERGMEGGREGEREREKYIFIYMFIRLYMHICPSFLYISFGKIDIIYSVSYDSHINQSGVNLSASGRMSLDKASLCIKTIP